MACVPALAFTAGGFSPNMPTPPVAVLVGFDSDPSAAIAMATMAEPLGLLSRTYAAERDCLQEVGAALARERRRRRGVVALLRKCIVVA
jgi:hypothetical protein